MGVVLFGSTGEFVHFDLGERMRLLMFAVRRSRVPVLVNVSHSTLVGTVDLAEHAIEVGAAGVLLMPPYFYVYGDSQLARFYEDFVRLLGGKIPIYLYNLPFFTNRISAELAVQLLGSGAFAGIKDSSGEWQTFESLNALQAKRRFQLLIGNESLYLRARSAGADGIVSGVAAANSRTARSHGCSVSHLRSGAGSTTQHPFAGVHRVVGQVSSNRGNQASCCRAWMETRPVCRPSG